MSDLQAVATFPGIAQIFSASMTFSAGVSPSFCLISLPPQQDFEIKPGTLTFTYGGTKIEFPDCIIDSSSLEVGPAGQIWTLRILDRRWKWAYGSTEDSDSFRTRFNIRLANGEILEGAKELQKDTRYSPRRIAKILYSAMGEKKPTEDQIKALPDSEPWPELEFVDANPARALADLCDSLGCRVVLKLDNKVWICKVGEGANLPDGGLAMNVGFGLKLNLRPDEIRVVGSPITYQAKFVLEPVGKDADGIIKPIDKLSYKPDFFIEDILGPLPSSLGGEWVDVDPVTMNGVTKCYKKADADKGVPVDLVEEDTLPSDGDAAGEDDPAAIELLSLYAHCRELAQQYVWRWYRIKGFAESGTFKTNKFGLKIHDAAQLLFSDTLIDLTVDADGNKQNVPAFCEGTFYRDLFENTLPFTLYRGSFSIINVAGGRSNNAQAIVAFGEPVYKIDDDGRTIPAEMYVTCSFQVRDNIVSAGFNRARFSRKMPGKKLDTGAMILRHDDLIETHKLRYIGKTALDIITNTDTIKKQADHYLDAMQKRFTPEPSTDVQYAGILGKSQLDLDGAIQQITYTLGNGQAAITRASRNAEHSDFTPSFYERRRREKLDLFTAAGGGERVLAWIAGAGADALRKLGMGSR